MGLGDRGGKEDKGERVSGLVGRTGKPLTALEADGGRRGPASAGQPAVGGTGRGRSLGGAAGTRGLATRFQASRGPGNPTLGRFRRRRASSTGTL